MKLLTDHSSRMQNYARLIDPLTIWIDYRILYTIKIINRGAFKKILRHPIPRIDIVVERSCFEEERCQDVSARLRHPRSPYVSKELEKQPSKIDVSIYNHADEGRGWKSERKKKEKRTVEASNLSAVIRTQYR